MVLVKVKKFSRSQTEVQPEIIPNIGDEIIPNIETNSKNINLRFTANYC